MNGMSSESVQEYLQAIYNINETGKPARTTELAEKMGVSPPSVTEMLIRLSEEGLLEYEPYKGATLTGKGTALAQKTVRKHRLLERLLNDVLHTKPERVHEEACKLEHALSDRVANSLCSCLNAPETCPDDGKPIPPCPLEASTCEDCNEAADEEENNPRMVTQLSSLRPMEEAKVAFARGGKRACQRLMDMGLTAGTKIRVINAAPFKGPVEVEVRDTRVAIGRGLASQVFVQVDPETVSFKTHPHGPHHGRMRQGWRT